MLIILAVIFMQEFGHNFSVNYNYDYPTDSRRNKDQHQEIAILLDLTTQPPPSRSSGTAG
jgi:hypothetical protein